MFPPGLRSTLFTHQRMRRPRSNLPCMTRSISSLLAALCVTASAAAQPAASPCSSDVAGNCVPGAPSVNAQPPSVNKPGFHAAIDRKRVRAHAAGAPLSDNDNANAELQKADPVLNPAWKRDFRVAPNTVQAGATVPARFTAERPPGAGLQSKPIADAQLSDETKRRSHGWLEYFPEWHAGWALIIGLLVVALRRVPIRFRSNGL